jgi:hypothetical protein
MIPRHPVPFAGFLVPGDQAPLLSPVIAALKHEDLISSADEPYV